jgi:hypothetical protein
MRLAVGSPVTLRPVSRSQGIGNAGAIAQVLLRHAQSIVIKRISSYCTKIAPGCAPMQRKETMHSTHEPQPIESQAH